MVTVRAASTMGPFLHPSLLQVECSTHRIWPFPATTQRCLRHPLGPFLNQLLSTPLDNQAPFSTMGTAPDEETGLWMVQPDFRGDGRPSFHSKALFALSICTSNFIRRSLTMRDVLDEFNVFYVNKYHSKS